MKSIGNFFRCVKNEIVSTYESYLDDVIQKGNTSNTPTFAEPSNFTSPCMLKKNGSNYSVINAKTGAYMAGISEPTATSHYMSGNKIVFTRADGQVVSYDTNGKFRIGI